MLAVRICSIAAFALTACSSAGGGAGNGGASGAGDGLSACKWPSSLDAAGGAPAGGQCQAKRALVQCSFQGLSVECLSDDPTKCPNVTSGTCVDQCASDEYAVSCGQVGPGPIGTPPAGCRNLLATPAGIVFYCCPCGS